MELIYQIAAAMGGAVFAALIGGTNAFVFTGFTGLAAVVLQLAGGGDILLTNVSGGPLFGPHVAFNSGVVALALYKRIQDSKADQPEVDGTNTFMPLFPFKPVIPIIAAGLTGPLAYYVNYLFSSELKLSLDTVALTIVIFNILTRLLIGKTGIVPKADSIDRFEEPNKSLLFNIIWGAALSLVIGYVTLATGNVLIGFYVSAFSLVFLSLGRKVPVTHHITLVAAYAAAQTGNIWFAVVFGIIATLFGEYFNPLVNTKADTLIDMPSFVIATLSFIIMTFL